MQVVINIDEEIYKRILPYKDLPIISNLCNDYPEITHAIANGVPISTGHGRLIDADEILNHAHIEEDEDGDIFVKKWYCIEKDVFDNALVLIDGEVEE
jgi:hypothetical protein